MENRNILVHTHIFKNAGSSFDDALARNFKDTFVDHRDDHLIHKDKEFLNGFIKENQNIRAFSSHSIYDKPTNFENVVYHTAYFIRHPIDRIKSVYSFEHKQPTEDSLGAKMAKEFDFNGYVAWRMNPKVPPTIRNMQTIFTAGIGKAHRRMHTRYEAALKTIEENPLIAVVDRYDESMIIFEEYLSQFFPNIDLSYVRRNITDNNHKLSVNEKANNILNELGKNLSEKVLQNNLYDIKLYEKANSILDEKIKYISNFKEKIVNFETRCTLKKIYELEKINNFNEAEIFLKDKTNNIDNIAYLVKYIYLLIKNDSDEKKIESEINKLINKFPNKYTLFFLESYLKKFGIYQNFNTYRALWNKLSKKDNTISYPDKINDLDYLDIDNELELKNNSNLTSIHTYSKSKNGCFKKDFEVFGLTEYMNKDKIQIPKLPLIGMYKYSAPVKIVRPGIVINEEKRIIFSSNQFSKEAMAKWLNDKGSEELNNRIQTSSKKQLNLENCILLARPGDHIYGHWLVDILPKVYLSEKYKANHFYYIIDSSTPSYVYEWLELLGVEKDKIIKWSRKDELIIIDSIHILSNLRYNFFFNDLITDFARFIKEKLNIKNTKPFRKIFISRKQWKEQKKNIRVLENIEEVENIMLNYGYEIVYPETLSLKEQVKLFSESSVIVGEDGSALHNSMFAPEKTLIGNLRVRFNGALIQGSLASAFNQKIYYLICNETERSKVLRNSPYLVKMDELQLMLDNISKEKK